MPRITRNSNKPILQPPNNIPLLKLPNQKHKTNVAQPVLLRNKALLGKKNSNASVAVRLDCDTRPSSSNNPSPKHSTFFEQIDPSESFYSNSMSTSNFDLEVELGIDTAGLSEENRNLAQILLKGMNTLVENQLTKMKLEHEKEIGTLKKQIITLEEKLDDLENYGRRNTMVISGKDVPRVTTDENSIDTAVECIRNRLGVDITRNDIDVAHRLGRPQATSEDRRSIIVKFTRRVNKHKIYVACRLKKPTHIFFSDSVSKSRSTIMHVRST